MKIYFSKYKYTNIYIKTTIQLLSPIIYNI